MITAVSLSLLKLAPLPPADGIVGLGRLTAHAQSLPEQIFSLSTTLLSLWVNYLLTHCYTIHNALELGWLIWAFYEHVGWRQLDTSFNP